MNNDLIADKAVAYFNDGFLCSESVLMALAEAYGIDSPHVPSIATAFGSGLSQTNGPCGALSGGILALSLLHGRNKEKQDYAQLYKNVALLQKIFNEKFASTACTQLLGFSMADSDASEKFTKNECKKNTCNHCVRYVVEEVQHILSSQKA
ncbi:MAG: C-GCAxxG-C-C family protein [Sulfurospirillaceae bacterium]|nr:C-GCAxxG-C-C family protein [Sulfurospirillaceae bacterium]MDD2826570.1 C-GCAxxG-C-C family protein [Sulfurospirillaceae bacterium]